MSDSLFQVLYIGPAQYDGTASERKALETTVASFIDANGGRGSELAGVKVSFSLGLFTVYTHSRVAAECMPGKFEQFERAYEVVEMSRERLMAAGPMYFEAQS